MTFFRQIPTHFGKLTNHLSSFCFSIQSQHSEISFFFFFYKIMPDCSEYTLAAENKVDCSAETTLNSPLLGCKPMSEDVETPCRG